MLTTLGHGEVLRFQHDGFEFNDGTRPAHDYSVDARLLRYTSEARILYIDRDPRDVIVSLYYQVTGRFRDFFDYRGDISRFIRDEYFGASVLARFRSMWKVILQERPYLHIRYEDLHHDTARVLADVLAYLDIESDAIAIAKAVDLGRLDNMKEVEQSGAFSEPWLKPRNGFPKVRRGAVGGYQEELSLEDIAYLNSVFLVDDRAVS